MTCKITRFLLSPRVIFGNKSRKTAMEQPANPGVSVKRPTGVDVMANQITDICIMKTRMWADA